MATSKAETLERPPLVLARSKATLFNNSHKSAGKWTPVVLYGRSGDGSDAAVFFAMIHSVTPVNWRLVTALARRSAALILDAAAGRITASSAINGLCCFLVDDLNLVAQTSSLPYAFCSMTFFSPVGFENDQ